METLQQPIYLNNTLEYFFFNKKNKMCYLSALILNSK